MKKNYFYAQTVLLLILLSSTCTYTLPKVGDNLNNMLNVLMPYDAIILFKAYQNCQNEKDQNLCMAMFLERERIKSKWKNIPQDRIKILEKNLNTPCCAQNDPTEN